MKKVLHVIGSMNRAGAECMLMNIFREVEKSKFEFHFLYFTEDKCDFDSEILESGGYIHRLTSGNSIQGYIEFYRLIKRYHFSAIHCHVLLANAMYILISRLVNVRTRIAHSHSTFSSGDGVIYKSYEIFSKFVQMHLSTKRLACGQAAGKYLFGNKQFEVIPNAIDSSLFYDYHNTKSVNDLIHIIHVARFEKVKNHKFVIELARKLIDANVNIVIHLVGRGSEYNHIFNLVEKYGLADVIKFLGVRNDIPNLLCNSDIMLLPSHFEGFPVVMIEAQMSGIKSIVSTDVASECDLGLGLVKFISTENIQEWVSSVKAYSFENRKYKIETASQRIKYLSEQGFDVKYSVNNIMRLYQ